MACKLGVAVGVLPQPTIIASNPLHSRAIKYFKVFTFGRCCVDYILSYGFLKVRDKVVASPLEVGTPVIIHEAVQAINLILVMLAHLN